MQGRVGVALASGCLLTNLTEITDEGNWAALAVFAEHDICKTNGRNELLINRVTVFGDSHDISDQTPRHSLQASI